MITALFTAFVMGIIYTTIGILLALVLETRPAFSRWLENWYFTLLMIYLWPVLAPLALILVSIMGKKGRDGWNDDQTFI